MKNDTELLKTIQAAYETIGVDFELEDVNGKPELICFMGGDELAPVDCSINAVHFESGSDGLQLSVTVFCDLDDETASCVQRLLPSMNAFTYWRARMLLLSSWRMRRTLLRIGIQCSITVIHTSHPADHAAVKQHGFNTGCLPRINMCENADCYFFHRITARSIMII